jgi:hypothetical protein
MPIYNVEVSITIRKHYEFEAKCEDTAGEEAEARISDEADQIDQGIVDSTEVLEVGLSDCQYTDQQELLDREAPYEQ